MNSAKSANAYLLDQNIIVCLQLEADHESFWSPAVAELTQHFGYLLESRTHEEAAKHTQTWWAGPGYIIAPRGMLPHLGELQKQSAVHC